MFITFEGVDCASNAAQDARFAEAIVAGRMIGGLVGPIGWIVTRLPPEFAHVCFMPLIRWRLWRPLVVLDALLTLAWTVPLLAMMRLFRAL